MVARTVMGLVLASPPCLYDILVKPKYLLFSVVFKQFFKKITDTFENMLQHKKRQSKLSKCMASQFITALCIILPMLSFEK